MDMEEGKGLLQRALLVSHFKCKDLLACYLDFFHLSFGWIGKKFVDFPTNSNVLDLIVYIQINQCNFDIGGGTGTGFSLCDL